MANGYAGVIEILEPVLQGEPQTYKFTVKDNDVLKGDVVSIHGNGEVRPAQTGDVPFGQAMFDAVIDDEVTVAIFGISPYIARMRAGESQTIVAGDILEVAPLAISGVSTYGNVGVQAASTFTDAAIATHDDAKINAAINGLIDEIQAGALDERQRIGIALESKTTDADRTAIIKVIVL